MKTSTCDRKYWFVDYYKRLRVKPAIELYLNKNKRLFHVINPKKKPVIARR